MLDKIRRLFKKEDFDTFTGIIDEDGVAISRMGKTIKMGFSFFAYILNNSEKVIEEEIYITKEIPNMEYDVSSIKRMDIIRITGKQIDYHGQKRIMLQSIQGTDISHNKLEKLKEKRAKSIIYESKIFGKLILERGPNWFKGFQNWGGQKIELMLIEEGLVKPLKSEKYAIQLLNFKKNGMQTA